MTNERIAAVFDQIANLLEAQAASPHRVRAWREGAGAIRASDRDVRDIFRDHGRAGLEALPHIGPRLASVLIEVITTSHSAMLDRLRGDAVRALEQLPGLGPCLAQRVHRELGISTLEELEVAIHDGTLASLPGFGARRIAALTDVVAARLRHRAYEKATTRPPVALLLDIDREYRAAAAAKKLPTIAPRRFNPQRRAWLPIMHAERDGWELTAMYSNTALAHQLGRTDDWVVIFFHEHGGEDARATVVTERRGGLVGRRVVRGREAECEAHYAQAFDRAAS